MTSTLGAKPTIDTTDFQNGIKKMNSELRVLESGFKASAAGLSNWRDTASGLEARMQSLTAQIPLQQQKVDLLRAAWEKEKAENGEGTAAANKLEVELNKGTETLNRMTTELTDSTTSLAKMSEEGDDTSESVDDLGNSADEAKGKLFSFGDVLKGIGTVAKVTVAGIVAVGTAAIATAGLIGALALNTADVGSKFADLSVQTGISATSLQEMEYAGGILGVSLDTITGAQARLIRSMSGGADGTGAQAEAFKSLGVSITDANGNLRDSQDVFNETIDALGRIENPTERDAASMALFGKSAQELNPLIKAGSGELAKLADEAHRMGAVMSEEDVAAADAFGDKIAGLQMGLQGTVAQIGLAFIPALSGLADQAGGYLQQLVGVVQGADGDIGKMAQGMGTLFGQIVTDLAAQAPAMLDAGLGMVRSLLDAITSSLPVILPAAVSIIKSLIGFIAQNLPMLISAAVDIILTLVNALVANLPMLVGAAMQAVIALVNGLAIAMPTLIPAIVEAIILIVNTLVNNAPMLIDAALALILGLATGLVAAIPILIPAIPQIIESIYKALIAALPKIGAAALQLLKTLGAGIVSNLPLLGSSIEKLVSVVISGMSQLYSAAIEAGSTLVEGIWDGIDGNLDWILGNVMDFAQSIIDAIKEVLGLVTPSPKPKSLSSSIQQEVMASLETAMAGVSLQMEMAMNGARPGIASATNSESYAFYGPTYVGGPQGESLRKIVKGRRY